MIKRVYKGKMGEVILFSWGGRVLGEVVDMVIFG